jgi:hypothetical protein
MRELIAGILFAFLFYWILSGRSLRDIANQVYNYPITKEESQKQIKEK